MVDILTNEKGQSSVKLNKLKIGEPLSFEVTRDPRASTGKYGDYCQVACRTKDGKDFAIFIPPYMVSNGAKLIERAKKWTQGEKVTITRRRNEKDTCNIYDVTLDEEKTKATKQPLGLKISGAQQNFTEEELDFIKQVKGSINTIDKDVLIASIIDSFASVGKTIDQAKAELIYAEAKK